MAIPRHEAPFDELDREIATFLLCEGAGDDPDVYRESSELGSDILRRFESGTLPAFVELPEEVLAEIY